MQCADITVKVRYHVCLHSIPREDDCYVKHFLLLGIPYNAYTRRDKSCFPAQTSGCRSISEKWFLLDIN